MLWPYITLALLAGVLAGTFTGLIPGVHTNLIAIILLGFSSFLLSKFNPLVLVVFIVSMGLTHTFIDYLPSIFLGAPDEDTALSILPGHEMLNQGRAYEAVFLTLIGSFAAVFLTIILSPIFIYTLPKAYPYIQNIIPFILIIASFFLIYFEKKKWYLALIIFLLAGFLGLSSLNLPVQQPLLPLLTGLFGASSLILSVLKKQKIPKQKIFSIKTMKKTLKNKSILKALFASLIASPLCCILPGLSSSQAAVIGSEVTGDLNRKEFLILLGSINTMIIGLSFITLYSLQKARTGAAIAIQQILPELSLSNLGIILLTIIITGTISLFLTLFLAKIFSKKITKIKYTKLSSLILIFLSIVVIFFSGWIGFIIFIISTSLGLTCIFLRVKRIQLMGALLIPTILFYLLI